MRILVVTPPRSSDNGFSRNSQSAICLEQSFAMHTASVASIECGVTVAISHIYADWSPDV